jgi:hypothetical protein
MVVTALQLFLLERVNNMPRSEAKKRAKSAYEASKRVRHTIRIETNEATLKTWCAAVSNSNMSQPDFLRMLLKKHNGE